MVHYISILLLSCVCVAGQTLRKVAAIDLPGPKGQRFDYLAMDDEDHWLLSAHLGPGLLYVIDVQANKMVKTIVPVPGITSLEYIPGLRKVYTPDWGEERSGWLICVRSLSRRGCRPQANPTALLMLHFQKSLRREHVG